MSAELPITQKETFVSFADFLMAYVSVVPLNRRRPPHFKTLPTGQSYTSILVLFKAT